MAKKNNPTKKPSVGYAPGLAKQPRIDPANKPESILTKKPTWKLGLLDKEGPWSCCVINEAVLLLDIQEKLASFESMTWGEIEKKRTKKGSSQNHGISVEKITKEARKRLKELRLDDTDELYSLRIGSTERIWGIRNPDGFSILWWDPDHEIYPVGKCNN